MIKNFIFLLVFLPLISSAQNIDLDSLVRKKMIIGFTKPAAKVGQAISPKCELTNPTYYKPIHSAYDKTTIVTDYILCNNGSPVQFFEIYDGENFKIISNDDLSFSDEVDKENLKVDFATMSAVDKTFLKENAGKMATFIIDAVEESINDKRIEVLSDALAPFDRVKKYGIGLVTFHPTEGYSSTGATFKIFNASSKTIKYIWFTVAGENAVEDLVRLSNGNYYTTLKGIGPIEPSGISSWEFDYVWFTDIIEYLRLSTIKIQYMDGTIKTMKYNEGMYLGQDALDKLNNIND